MKRGGPLARYTELKPGGPLKRSGRLNPVSDKQKQQWATQKEAYANAADAGAEWCFCCGKPGPVEHSHIYPQGMYSQHRNDERNWLQLGKWCKCHPTFENNKPLFAKKYPHVWAVIIDRMQAIDPKAYDFYAATTPELYPD